MKIQYASLIDTVLQRYGDLESLTEQQIADLGEELDNVEKFFAMIERDGQTIH